MASSRDVLNAQRFNRQRLVTAFTSGTPGGRELEPRSVTPSLVVGAVFGIVAIIVAIVLGRMSPTLPDGWDNGALIVDKTSGARYFSQSGTLHPVTSVTVARLLADPASFKVVFVGSDAILGKPRGAEIDLSAAPDDVPSPDSLRSNEWTACATGEDKTSLWIAGPPPSPLEPAETVLVTSDGKEYLIADRKRHEITNAQTNVIAALKLDQTPSRPVDPRWLDLFSRGSNLWFDVPANAPLDQDVRSSLPASLRTASVGSVITIAETDRKYLVISAKGQVEPLDEVGFALWKVAASTGPLPATTSDLDALDIVGREVAPSDWPTSIKPPLKDGYFPCATLQTENEGLVPALAGIEDPSSDTTPLDWPQVDVKGGSGALVRVSLNNIGSVRLVTDTNMSYSLGQDSTDSLNRLGYGGTKPLSIPGEWLAFLRDGGVELTHDAAVGQPR